MKKTPKKPSTLKHRPRGRPRKNGHGRKEVSVGFPPDLLAQLDRYVLELRKTAPGASRGDVISNALCAFGPFRHWLTRRAKGCP
ncbi:MAG TPA: hypothetical protein VGM13_08665 [Thermoanaerobaculia bacterium]|jgi:hypothetical protein